MATQKTQNKAACVSYNGFDGIDGVAAHSGNISIEDMVNFRILEDGSIEKRCGFKKLYEYPKDIQTYWCGIYGGKPRIYFLVNDIVSKFELESGEAVLIGRPSGIDMTNPRFFMLDGRLYLATAGGFTYVQPSGAFASVSGYVPHVGKDWSNDTVGEINEPLNILNRKARFTYTVSDQPSIFFRVLYPVKTIDKVEVNGIAVASSKYYFDSLYNSVNVSGLDAGDHVEIAVTYDLEESSSLSAIRSANRVEVFGGMTNNRAFFWNDSGESVIFSTGYVSPAEEADCNRIYTGISKNYLYFPEGYEFKVGSGANVVKAATRHYDRLLFFTDRDVWMADNETCAIERIPTMNINSKIGCTTARGVAMAGNDPVSVGRDKIYRWTSQTDKLNECNAYCISTPIAHLLPKDFFSNAAVTASSKRAELFFYDPNSTDGVVWVYQWEKKLWYRFDGINAKVILDVEGTVCFIRNNGIYCFDEEMLYDYDGESVEFINARVESGILELGGDAQRRLKGICIRGDLIESLKVTLAPEGISPVIYEAKEILTRHGMLRKRLTSGRFRQMRLKLEASGADRTLIHSVELTAK